MEVHVNVNDPIDTEVDVDVAIVGGGIVGTTLAVALKNSGLSVALIEAQTESEAIAKGQAYAIHLGSKKVWQQIQIWDAIEPNLERFNHVHVSDADYPHIVKFKPQDLNQKPLGYVAEHHILLEAFLKFLHHECPNVKLYSPCRVVDIRTQSATVSIQLQPSSPKGNERQSIPNVIHARLLVGADGAQSKIRQLAGIQVRGKHYHQSCLVATIGTEQSHCNIAYEKFWPSGPFAILPAQVDRCRIVWTAPHQEAHALLKLSDDEFIQRLQHRYGDKMGQLKLLSQRYIFPAQIQHAKQYVRHRLALVGNAAHTCHPVGGQGLNLGIQDAATLANILSQAHQNNHDVGDLRVLKIYERQRKHQNFLSLSFTDLLNQIFSNEIPVIQVLRRLGLRLMRSVPILRITALKFMAGLLVFQNPVDQPIVDCRNIKSQKIGDALKSEFLN